MIQNIKMVCLRPLLAWLWWYICCCECSAFILLAEFDWCSITPTLWAVQCCDQTRIRFHSKVKEWFFFPPVAPSAPVIATATPLINIISVTFIWNFICTSWNDKVRVWKCVVVFLFVFVWIDNWFRWGWCRWCCWCWFYKTIAIQDF